MSRPIKICFISFNSFPLFQTNSKQYFGGAEVQISIIAKYLAKDKNFSVHVITGDYNQPVIVRKNKLILYKGFRRHWHVIIKIIRTLLISKKINADFYVGRTASNLLWLMAVFCRIYKKKLIYMVAHDWDCQKDKANPISRVNRKLFIKALSMTNLIVAQTKTQQQMIKKNLGLNSIVMYSLLAPIKRQESIVKKIILWVGRADWWKQPKKFIKLAQNYPNEKMVMICRQGLDKKLFAEVQVLAKKQPNLTFLPAVPFEAIISFFSRAKLLINTSIAEGFPNTFLQAGLTKTPVLSFKVNPDRYLTRFNCGIVGKNNFPKIIKQPEKLKIMGLNHYHYVKNYHSAKNIEIFKKAITSL